MKPPLSALMSVAPNFASLVSVAHKIFDNGNGNATIAGGQDTMWTTALQIGELVDTTQRAKQWHQPPHLSHSTVLFSAQRLFRKFSDTLTT
jgi:hypothetical protein